jgi:hypothetical protein
VTSIRCAGVGALLSFIRRGQPVGGEKKTVTNFLAKIVAWITAGYPDGVPGSDQVPLFALMRQRLTDDEVKAVAKELIDRGEFDHVDIGVLITEKTDDLPSPADIERVRARLAAKGWPLDDPRDAEET